MLSWTGSEPENTGMVDNFELQPCVLQLFGYQT